MYMSDFLYKVELPFSGNIVSFKEIPTKDQLFLTKSMLVGFGGLEGDKFFLEKFGEYIQRNVQNIQIDQLSIIEVLLIALKMRSISMGNICKLQATQEDKQTTIEIDCELFLKNVYLGLKDIPKEHWVITYNISEQLTIEIKMGWPLWKQFSILSGLVKMLTNPAELNHHLLPLFIQEIIITDENNITKWTPSSDYSFDFNKVPAAVQQKIIDQLLANIKVLGSIDLFQLKGFDWRLNLFDPNILEVFKLPFLCDLADIHREIFILSGQLDSDYILNLSPQERRVYLNFYPKSQNPQESSIPNNSKASPEVQQLAQEFGQVA